MSVVNCVIVQQEEEWKGEMPKDGVYTPLRRIRASKKIRAQHGRSKKKSCKSVINENLSHIFNCPPTPTWKRCHVGNLPITALAIGLHVHAYFSHSEVNF